MSLKNVRINLSTALVTGLFVVAGTVFAMVPGAAHAAGTHLCLNFDQSKCLVTHGIGNQLTIGTTGQANITSTFVGNWNGKLMVNWEDGNGNCIRENNSNAVIVANGPCQSSDNSAKWAQSNDGHSTFQNRQHTSDYLATFGTASGTVVWGNAQGTGWYVSWGLQ
jgi:hypothetical protein